jgi:hypothetical protein
MNIIITTSTFAEKLYVEISFLRALSSGIQIHLDL